MAYSSKERVLAVLSGELPDRVPIFDCLLHDGVFEYFGFKEADIAAGDTGRYLAACSKCLDLCHPSGGRPYKPGETIHDDGSKTVVERWTTWNIPAPSQSLLSDYDENKIKANLMGQIEYLESLQGKAEYTRSSDIFQGDMIYITVAAELAIPYGNTETEILTYADFPELVAKKMFLQNNLILERFQATAYKEISPVAIIWNDLGYKNGLFFPPDVLERLYYPALSEVCALLHSRGIRVLYHNDGDISSILSPLIKCGIDGLNPIEISAGMNYAEIKREYGDKLAIVGGMDAVDILAFGSVDDVVRETKKLIDIAGKNGGLIAASSSGEIDMSMPTENVIAFYETVWKYGKY